MKIAHHCSRARTFIGTGDEGSKEDKEIVAALPSKNVSYSTSSLAGTSDDSKLHSSLLISMLACPGVRETKVVALDLLVSGATRAL